MRGFSFRGMHLGKNEFRIIIPIIHAYVCACLQIHVVRYGQSFANITEFAHDGTALKACGCHDVGGVFR